MKALLLDQKDLARRLSELNVKVKDFDLISIEPPDPPYLDIKQRFLDTVFKADKKIIRT